MNELRPEQQYVPGHANSAHLTACWVIKRFISQRLGITGPAGLARPIFKALGNE
jgi:hypothetical protein